VIASGTVPLAVSFIGHSPRIRSLTLLGFCVRAPGRVNTCS
jgi:hypothetical protein